MNRLHLAEQKMLLNKFLYLFLRGSLLSESGDRNDTFTPLMFSKSEKNNNPETESNCLGISKVFGCFHSTLFDLQDFTVHWRTLTMIRYNRTLPSSCVCCSGSVWVWEEGGSFSIFSSVMRLSVDWQQELEGFESSFSKELHLVARHSNNASTFTSEISWAVWERKKR